MRKRYLATAALVVAGCSDVRNEDAFDTAQTHAMKSVDDAGMARPVERRTVSSRPSATSLPSLPRIEIPESDIAFLSDEVQAEFRQRVVIANFNCIVAFLDTHTDAVRYGGRLPDDFELSLVMAWSYARSQNDPMNASHHDGITTALTNIALGHAERLFHGVVYKKEGVHMQLLERALRTKELIVFSDEAPSPEVDLLIRDMSAISTRFISMIAQWRARAFLTKDAMTSANQTLRDLMPIIERVIILGRAGHQVPESFMNDLQRLVRKAIVLASSDLDPAVAPVEEAANFEQHTVLWGHFTDTLETLARLSNDEFNRHYRKRTQQVTSKLSITSDYLKDLADIIHVTPYNFNAISQVKREVSGLTEDAISEYNRSSAIINSLSEEGLHAINFSVFSKDSDERVDLAQLKRSKRYWVSYGNYLADVVRMFGYLETKLSEFQKLALIDRMRPPPAKPLIEDAGPVAPSTNTAPVPSLEVASEPPEDNEPSMTTDGSSEFTGAELDSWDESDEKIAALPQITKEEITSTKSEYYRQTNLVIVRNKKERLPLAPRDNCLPRSARAAWERMKRPGKSISTSEMLAFFSGLYDLGKIHDVQLGKKTLKIYFTDRSVKAFHHRHYGFDRTTLGVIKEGLADAQIIVETLF